MCGRAQRRTLFVHCSSLNQAAELANYIAPEHLELQVADKSIAPLTQKFALPERFFKATNTDRPRRLHRGSATPCQPVGPVAFTVACH